MVEFIGPDMLNFMKKEKNPCKVVDRHAMSSKNGRHSLVVAASSHGLFISKQSTFQLQCFSDSDSAGCPYKRRSTNDYLIFLRKKLASWSSEKQSTIARSSVESEYKAMANTTAELTTFLRELGYPPTQPANLWCDNTNFVSTALRHLLLSFMLILSLH
ncbi:hypothetical protein V6N11_018913 [Hibiscus sabdariffa]|uniref:Uncharacterized protein n=1 Tax=Hibiscus sabdariffa TaxID=183260 RepID=A0ABR2R1E1_9ROSI